MGLLKINLKSWTILLISSLIFGGFLSAAENTSHYFLLTIQNDSIEISAHNRDGSLDKTYEGLVSMKTIPPIKTMAGKIYFSKYDEGTKYFIKPPVTVPTQVLMVDGDGAFGQSVLMPPPVKKNKPAPRVPPSEENDFEDPKEKPVRLSPPIEPQEPTVIILPENEKTVKTLDPKTKLEKVIRRLPRPNLKTSAQKEETEIEKEEEPPSVSPSRLPIRRKPLPEIEEIMIDEEKTEAVTIEPVEKEKTIIGINDIIPKPVIEKEKELLMPDSEERYSFGEVKEMSTLEVCIKILFIGLMSYFLFSYGRFLHNLKKTKIK